MDSSIPRALYRLRDPNHPATAQLASLVVDRAFATPLGEVVDAGQLTAWLLESMRALGEGDGLATLIHHETERVRGRLENETRPIGHWLPEDAEAPLKEALSQPWTPDGELTFRLINQAAIRHLVRDVLEATLLKFADRLRSLDRGVLGGVGGAFLGFIIRFFLTC